MIPVLPQDPLDALSPDLLTRTCIFGVVNVTPDSFYDGGKFTSLEQSLSHACHLLDSGADVADIGGESTRPGAQSISADEECRRVIPLVEELCRRVPGALISIDTTKATVARAAVEAGASIINDVSGGHMDPEIIGVAAQSRALLILGHLRGTPATMQQDIHFRDVVTEVADELRSRVRTAICGGLHPKRIWVDPGLGFGKTADQSLALIRNLAQLKERIGYPVLVGPSRKSFLGAVTGESVEERLMSTAAATVAAIVAGATAVRLHDVAALRSAVKIADALAGR